jgi:hypothetical protein
MIETMCNEILGNYTKKEDQLMTAAFGTRPKRKLNRVMDALIFEYPDYERLNKGVEGVKRKRVVSILGRQAARMLKEDEKSSKKLKSSPEPKAVTLKKRRAATPEPKVAEMEEETPSTPSAAEVEEILKVMTKSLPIKLLRSLGLQLTKLLQKKDEPSAQTLNDQRARMTPTIGSHTAEHRVSACRSREFGPLGGRKEHWAESDFLFFFNFFFSFLFSFLSSLIQNSNSDLNFKFYGKFVLRLNV